MRTVEFAFSNFMIEYLDEIETKFENILACLSGGPNGFESWKNRGRKYHDKLALKHPLRLIPSYPLQYVQCIIILLSPPLGNIQIYHLVTP